MLFTSFHYILFISIVITLYWMLPGPRRWILLAGASLIFYAAHIPEYIAVLVVSVIINYYFGIRIGRTEDPEKRKKILTGGVIMNLALLGLFKYADELILMAFPSLVTDKTFNDWFLFSLKHDDSPLFTIVLPLGISFFTFTNIAYLIDIKRGTIKPETHPGYFMVFITYFPKLIQGPIERGNHFLPQVRQPREFNPAMAVDGLRLLLWGFFKKLVIADRLGVAVDQVFGSPEVHAGPVLVFTAILYSFQIYFDFSSYIDIARGTSKLLGFDLLKNFNLPYLATSIKDFWDRWHITLSTWLRDYIFLPVAFRSSRLLRRERYLGLKTDQYIYAIAASVTFVLAGLWHGTGWNYIFWGALFAFYLVVANLTVKIKRSFYRATGLSKRKGIFNFIQILITFSLVTFAWIFFRAESLEAAFFYISRIPLGWGLLSHPGQILPALVFPGFTLMDLAMVVPAIIFTEMVEYHFYHKKILVSVKHPPRIIRWGVYYALLLVLFVFGKFETEGFIYFQF